ncbi:MAG: hypothetical protein SNF33_02185 [Candidatus Algichlamydia australiensis]|nr:hypothetical protein [Chlamydiales bacterium]
MSSIAYMFTKLFVSLTLMSGLVARTIPEKEQEKWRFISAYRRNSKGEAFVGPNKKRMRSYALLNTETGDIYREVSEEAMSLKCFEIALTSFPYTVINASLHFFKTFWDMGAVGYNTYNDLYQKWNENLGEDFSKILEKNGVDFCSRIGRDLYELSSFPFFSLAIFASGIRGMVMDPYDAAETIAWLEEWWHLGNPARNNDLLRHFSTVCEEKSDWSLYLAYCIQKIGNVDDLAENGLPKWEIVEYRKNQKEFDWFEEEPCPLLPLIPRSPPQSNRAG